MLPVASIWVLIWSNSMNDTVFDFSSASLDAFRAWLERRLA
jgi:hypothetical protein